MSIKPRDIVQHKDLREAAKVSLSAIAQIVI